MKDYELREALKSIAADMHSYDSNPITWSSWMIYLLDQLERQATDVDPANRQSFLEMITHLSDAIHTRKQRGAW